MMDDDVLNSIARQALAQRLHAIQEDLKTGPGGVTRWTDLTDEDRDFYRCTIEELLDEYVLINRAMR
jgi:hypothetical protein